MESVTSPQSAEGLVVLSKKEKWITRGFVVMLIAYLFLQRATLVDQIHPALSFGSGAAGFAVGAWWAQRISLTRKFQSNIRRMAGLGLIPFLTIFVGTYLARVAVELAGFVGTQPTIENVEAKVTDFRRGSKWPGQYASFKVDDNSRDIEVKVTPELHDSLDPWRSPGRDCLILQVQQGRGGIRRTVLPNLSFDEPLGVEHYRRCNSAT